MITGAVLPDVPPWTVRYHWVVPAYAAHPLYTYAEHVTERGAMGCAAVTLDNQAPDDPLRIISAHVKLPGGDWWRVGSKATNMPEVRNLMQVYADEVVPGDLVRDGGVFRSVSHVTPVASAGALLVHFGPLDGLRPNLSVPLFELISVWRVCGAS